MGETTLNQALEDFQKIYLPSRNYAPRTRIEYRNDIKEVIDFLTHIGIHRVGKVALPHLERYLAVLDQQGLAGSTRKRKAITIRTFFGFLYSIGYVTTDVTKRLIPPYTESPLPRFLTQTEYQRLRDVCSHNRRDAALVELLLQTGIRLSELVHLTINDIDIPDNGDMGLLRVLEGGGRRSRILPLNSTVCQKLKLYLAARSGQYTDALYINRFGRPMGARGVQKQIEKYLTRAGIRGASVHSLRHTFGTHHAAKGTDIETIQEIMGLKDKRSADVYVTMAKVIQQRELEDNHL